MATERDVQEWIKSLHTDEVCPRCGKGKIIRYNKAFFCSKNGDDPCKYGIRPSENYKGAALEITKGRPLKRKNGDHKRAIEEDFTEGQRGTLDFFD